MQNSSISVSNETKDILTTFRTKFGFKTYDSVINNIALFVLRNDINPKDDFIGDFKSELMRLEKRLLETFEESHKKITKDNASLRSWVGGITKDNLVPMMKKLDLIVNSEIDIKSSSKEENQYLANPLNFNVISSSNENKESTEMTKELELKEQKYKELFSKYEHQKQALFKIFNNAKIEQGGMLSKSKIYINMDAEEWESLKENS
jgi:hypothetical protein